jgi:urease accessory protein
MQSLLERINVRTTKPGNQRVRGQLHLGFVYDHAMKRTGLAVCEQQPPLKVIRAFPLAEGGALVHLHNLSGGVLGGDRLQIAVEVGPGAHAQLTSTSTTRLYRTHPNVPAAAQTGMFRVEHGGLLEYVPDPLIPFAGSRYQQQTQIELSADAGLFWWETVAPGRVARGESFEYELLQIGLDISAQGKPLAVERLRLEPGRRRCSSLARLGSYCYFGSFYVCRVGLDAARWLHLERELSELAQKLTCPPEIVWGVSTLVAHGLVIRVLSRQGREIPLGLMALWRAAKLALYGREAIPPRKLY